MDSNTYSLSWLKAIKIPLFYSLVCRDFDHLCISLDFPLVQYIDHIILIGSNEQGVSNILNDLDKCVSEVGR